MSKTIQEAFQEAVLAGAKDDASVLVKYGVNLGAAVSAFTGARNFDAVKAVVDLGGDATNGIHSILFGKGAGLAHI